MREKGTSYFNFNFFSLRKRKSCSIDSCPVGGGKQGEHLREKLKKEKEIKRRKDDADECFVFVVMLLKQKFATILKEEDATN